MFELEEKSYFMVLLIIPAVVVLFILVQFWKKRTQKRFADVELMKRLSPNTSVFKGVLKLVLWSLAITCFAIALVNPKFGTRMATVKREGVDMVFAIDVSKSMLAEDIAPNRIQKSKQLTTQIINSLVSDRIGIIAYAGKAYPQLPITTDYAAAKMFLQNMNTNMLSSQGTAIDDAINLAKTYFNDEEQTNRILFIISDGEDHSENAISAAEAAHEEGIKIFTIGVGKPEGGPIPLKINGVVDSYKKDRDGETVITKLNDEILKEIAEETDGIYIDGSNTKLVIDKINETLKGMDKKEFESKQYTEFNHQFQWFLGFAFFFLFLDIFFLERKTGWLQKLNLFNEK
ncbi:MAG: VWA domain-containing protein [Flavobacteriaceae bacterium]|nr:VWA domain-containing protein [Flavobacteriaceae bacterium]